MEYFIKLSLLFRFTSFETFKTKNKFIFRFIMTIKLYYLDLSPPARAVNLVINALGLKVEYINVNLLEKEHLKPDFIKVVILLLLIV